MAAIKILNINVQKLSQMETIRYSGPAPDKTHGVYTIQLATRDDTVDTNIVQIHMSLEATMQLRQRIDAALAHMVTH